MSNWKDDYQKMLLEASGYSGNRKPGMKRISASSLSSNMLELYLDFKHGKGTDSKFEQSNLGSVYQLGVDKACEGSKQYRSAIRYEHKLPNGWIVSGEVDQIDDINKVIIDNKVTTATAKKKILQEGRMHSYGLQQAVYKYLMWKNGEGDYEAALALVDKSSSYFKPKSGDCMNYMDLVTLDYEEIEEMLISKTNELQEYIDNDVEPAKCADVFPFKTGGGTKPMKCIYYCNFKEHCKHSTDYQRASSAAMNLASGVEGSLNDINPFDIDGFNF